SGATIRTLASGDSKFNAISVGHWDTPLESREVGTEDKLVIAACEDGILYGLDVRASEESVLDLSINYLSHLGTVTWISIESDSLKTICPENFWPGFYDDDDDDDDDDSGSGGKKMQEHAKNTSWMKLMWAFQRRSYNKAPVRACAFSSQHALFATGTSEGVVEVYDIRQQG
ncbi:hypothetical protein BGW38_009591, partial [Lunasporangiospora selenospora]